MVTNSIDDEKSVLCSLHITVTFGFKNVSAALTAHERSVEHRDCAITTLIKWQSPKGIDREIKEQYEEEKRYCKAVLKRNIAATQFLSLEVYLFVLIILNLDPLIREITRGVQQLPARVWQNTKKISKNSEKKNIL